jgi:rubrerythrin
MKSEDFRQIISQAIDGEIEAYTFYCAVADRVADAALKNIFAELAADELNHQDFLQQVMLKGSRALYVEESHEFKPANNPELPPLSVSFKPIDGILLAIRKKLDAMQMYTQLSQAARDPEDKHAFLELAKMEQNQKASIEDIYAKMTFPEAW